MNPVVEAIKKRRSTRSFREEALSKETIQTILECGRWAPSANNRQKWTFVVVSNRQQIEHLAGVIAQTLGNGDYNMYKPACLIMVAHEKGEPFGREDDACAMQNMFLAAESLGIGSVWINQLQGICDEALVRQELQKLGVPDSAEVHGMCALGYTDKQTAPRLRQSSVVWA